MKKKELERITSTPHSRVKYCKVLNQGENSITFEVDENLEISSNDLREVEGSEIVSNLLETEQIDESLSNIVACSFWDKDLIDVGSDVLYKTIITCYGRHHPLVLSPDMVWLLIAQTLAKHIFKNSEKYRDKIVNHSGQMDIVIESDEDLLGGNPNWGNILDGFYKKIERNTKEGIAANIVADFSTTEVNDRIASVATLMHGVQSYFRYEVCHCICGIPYIVLKGSTKDWEQVLLKASILNRFDLKTWYSWLRPILSEFVKASEGKANKEFWKNIVRRKTPAFCPGSSGCVPDYVPVDGWCTALFPYEDMDNPDSGRIIYDHSLSIQRMESEMLRVGFKYVRFTPNGEKETFPMELWSGMVGAEEDPKTHSLTPVIGWFVRLSEEEKESIGRLKGADECSGIDLRTDTVPDILKKLDKINSLRLFFTDKVYIPEWMYNMKIGNFEVYGEIDEEYKSRLERIFKNIKINQ